MTGKTLNPWAWLGALLWVSALLPLAAQPDRPNRVLELDGNGSYAELPVGTANDASPAAHHGRLRGNARKADADLPAAIQPRFWAGLRILPTDASGARVEEAVFQAEIDGRPVPSAFASVYGDYWLTGYTNVPAMDVTAWTTNRFAGRRRAVPLEPFGERTLEWTLGGSVDIEGRVQALDEKTPWSATVVELVAPDRTAAEPPQEALERPPYA